MKNLAHNLAVILMPVVGFALPTLAADYTAIKLGGSRTFAINDKNQIAGQLTNQFSFTHAVLWEKAVMSDLGTLGGRSSTLGETSTVGASRHCLNNIGQVVGWSETADGSSHAFVWQNGVMTDLGPLPNTASSAAAINDAGQIVGTIYNYAGTNRSHAVLWQNGAIVDLGLLTPGGNSAATDINATGQVTGWGDTASGMHHAFLWQNGLMTDLGALGGDSNSSESVAIDSSGAVTGSSFSPANLYTPHAFFWTPESNAMIDLGTLGGPSTVVHALNGLGQVVGWSYPATGSSRPFLWQNGLMTDLGTFGGDDFGAAADINQAGQVVGYSSVPSVHAFHPFLWQNGQMTDLGTLGGNFSSANAINNTGWTVGYSSLADGSASAALWIPGAPPVADASATPTQVISPNNVSAQVTLDGSRSSHADGDPLTYTWFLDGHSVNIGTGVKITVGLSIGSVVVTLDVSDGWRTSSSAISVTVITVAQAVNNLMGQVSAVSIQSGVKNTLLNDLSAAVASFNRGSFTSGANQLQQFINDVNAQSGKKLDAATATAFIAAARAIITAVAVA